MPDQGDPVLHGTLDERRRLGVPPLADQYQAEPGRRPARIGRDRPCRPVRIAPNSSS
ncbi:hypothetical protein [Nocardia arthritidis]|uniref:Uncharacterized protein n=1 Tax=Nocardia arthritidis TaxID=228602 RepID=A0A6G9YN35_9NOCA|nr:hypothetical protein [Nocardia arthritidis]QIS14530.1 hypothetical protein F5544_33470 [Nocardia arthritidis]